MNRTRNRFGPSIRPLPPPRSRWVWIEDAITGALVAAAAWLVVAFIWWV